MEQLAEHSVSTSGERLLKVLEKVVTDDKYGFVLLARENGQAIGIAYVAVILSAEHCGLVAWLEELYVTPNRRCQGIGTALVSAVLKRAREVGIAAVDMEIDVGHNQVESLYRRFGFTQLQRSRWVRVINGA